MMVAAGTVALNISYEGLFLIVILIMTKKWLLLNENIPISRLECKNHTLFTTKMAKISEN